MSSNSVEAQVSVSPEGAIVFDAACMGAAADPRWFEPQYWREHDALVASAQGRGQVHFVRGAFGTAVLRHYRRGGLVARLNGDRYWWNGAERTRAFREFRLLAFARHAQLPVPAPLAARCTRAGMWYRADILVSAIDASVTVAKLLEEAPDRIPWQAVGKVIGQVHAAGVFHADLNAHNVLIDAGDRAWLIDFDRAERRLPAASWQASNLKRLHRSLLKLGATRRLADFEARHWTALLAGHAHALAAGG